MSNLSELLPAGGAAKEFEPVASGTLPNGTAVILNANGTVEAISESSAAIAQNIPVGSEVTFNSGETQFTMIAFDPNTTGKFVVAYQDGGNTNDCTAVVGTISGNTISFGSEVDLNTGNVSYVAVAFDPSTAGKCMIIYQSDSGGSGVGYARVGTISGTSISFGSEATFEAGDSYSFASIAADPNTANKYVIAYRDNNASGQPSIAKVATVSGTSISFGSDFTFYSGVIAYSSIAFDPSIANKFVIVYRDNNNSNQGTIVVGTVSGTSLSFSAPLTFSTGSALYTVVAFDPNTAGKLVVFFRDAANANKGTAIVGTVSGVNVNFGSPAVLDAGSSYCSISFAAGIANKFVVTSQIAGTGYGTASVGTISGTSISFNSPTTFNSADTNASWVACDPNSIGKFVAVYDDVSVGKAILGQIAIPAVTTLTSTNFVGITAEAIADTATGKVNPKGGVASSVANIAPTMPFGSEYVFNAGTSIYTSMAFDPNNAKKFVAVYRDTSNSNYGTAIVGTVSGNSISYGPEVVFYSGQTAFTSIAFDPNTSGKFVVSYMDVTSGGSACVGTVSGTNITFGTAVVFETSEANYSTIAFDPSTAGKFIITYLIGISTGNAIVGTVSGTSITFGTTAVFEAAKAEFPSVSFDPNDSGKFVIAYSDGGNSDYGTAIAGTISGTTPSFGSAAVFDSVACSRTNVSFDPNTAGKFVVAYRGGSEHGNAVVGTVSGTSLSFGSNVVFNNTVTSEMAISFDSGTGGKFVIAYQDDVNSEYGTAILGVLSGTSVSFSLKTVFNTGDTLYPSIAFDPNTAGEFVVTYRDVDNSNYGTSVVGNISSALTIGSNYYLQTDGTVSTATASQAINIGRAISPTSLILR